MSSNRPIVRSLGTMVVYGGTRDVLGIDLGIAEILGATHLEILPDWGRFPDPVPLRKIVADRGFVVHSAHGCWGGQAIRARRVDLGSLDAGTRAESLDDIGRCLDWLAEAGGEYLVVHPGGLSDPAQAEDRRKALGESLQAAADRCRGTAMMVCVENMPLGVHPGSRMADLAAIVAEIDHPHLGLALDTGHANISETVSSATTAAGRWLRTTHVHDNNGKADNHLPPGMGTIDWDAWVLGLDAIGYEGPILLECIRHLREKPESVSRAFIERLASWTGR